MKLVVGLGNPGRQYEGTRHNIGFAVLDYLASAPFVGRWRERFQGKVTEAVLGLEQVLLLKPQTFMNLSGRSVREAMDFYKLTLSEILVVCDDIALPLGKLRVRPQGSHGGNNGLRSIQEMLGTMDYPRLRIGVGSPGEHLDAAGHVLSRFKSGERRAVEDAVAKAAEAVAIWVEHGIDVCMNRVNADPKPDKPKKERTAKDKKSDVANEPKKSPNPDN
jgi:PTH1 family peptidyl-tRNA hydrolase